MQDNCDKPRSDLGSFFKVMLTGNIWTMQVKCAHRHETDWQTTDEAQGSSRQRWCSFFSFTDVTLTFPSQQPKVIHTTNTCLLHLKTNTNILRLHLWYVFLCPEPQRPRLQNYPDSIFSLHETSVFYLPLSCSVLSPCQSLSLSLSLLKLPSRAHKTALSCNTNFPT